MCYCPEPGRAFFKEEQLSDIPDFLVDNTEKEAVFSDSVLAELRDLVIQKKDLESRIEKGEALLKELKKDLEDIDRRKIPALTIEQGITSINVQGIGTVKVEPDVSTSISDIDQFHSFLESRDELDIIKAQLLVDADREFILTAASIPYTKEEKVHPSTLRAYVKRLIYKQGEADPPGVKVTPYYRTTIK